MHLPMTPRSTGRAVERRCGDFQRCRARSRCGTSSSIADSERLGAVFSRGSCRYRAIYLEADENSKQVRSGLEGESRGEKRHGCPPTPSSNEEEAATNSAPHPPAACTGPAGAEPLPVATPRWPGGPEASSHRSATKSGAGGAEVWPPRALGFKSLRRVARKKRGPADRRANSQGPRTEGPNRAAQPAPHSPRARPSRAQGELARPQDRRSEQGRAAPPAARSQEEARPSPQRGRSSRAARPGGRS